MRHHYQCPDFPFVHEPVEFDKYSDRGLLQYCLGAVMYMPGTKDFGAKIIRKAVPGLTTLVLCLEDACPEEDVPMAEENILNLLETVNKAIEDKRLTYKDLPLIFVRVRSLAQFKSFAKRVTPSMAKALTGFNFPKFNSVNGGEYFEVLKEMNLELNEILYGMPILEDPRVALKETRLTELIEIKKILDSYKKYVLQVRVGATDFSSCFGVRRGVYNTIYEILPVAECLSDILNVFSRHNEYVVSGPVWEYFRQTKGMMFEEVQTHGKDDFLFYYPPILNNEIDGLIREVLLDKANGFVGRTIIHPTHVIYVNALMAVTTEEYDDACQILDARGGVIKSAKLNKMNEINPHTNWAKNVFMRAKAFGVVQNEHSYMELFSTANE
ncbi:MAG TPA: HpcH/HpaI aldolase/citrate lyase family protein [Clostridiaceae bacterium]|nr:HpcH/HpaI aldolase/citrate lyase family protein [Clostridiaceae bacterium]